MSSDDEAFYSDPEKILKCTTQVKRKRETVVPQAQPKKVKPSVLSPLKQMPRQMPPTQKKAKRSAKPNPVVGAPLQPRPPFQLGKLTPVRSTAASTLPAFVGHGQVKDKAVAFFEARSKEQKPKDGPALFIEGPPGNGKTLLVKTLCQMFSFNLAPLTSSKIGSWSDLCYFIDRVAYTASISGASQCILVDHVDILVTMGSSVTKLGPPRTKAKKGTSSGSTANDLGKLLKGLKANANPIVFTAASLDSKPLRDLAAACLHLKTYGLSKADLLALTRRWLKREDVTLAPSIYTRLVEESYGDMRRLENELKWASINLEGGGRGKRSAGSSDILTTAAARTLFASTSHIFAVTGNPAKNLARSNVLFGLDDRLGPMIHHNYLRSLGPKDMHKAKRLGRLLLKGQSLANQAWCMGGYGFAPMGHALQGWALATIRAKPLSDVQYTKIPALAASMRAARTRLTDLQTMMDLRVADSEELWVTLGLVKEMAHVDGPEWPESWSLDKIQEFSLP